MPDFSDDINDLIEEGIIKITCLEPLKFALTEKGLEVAEQLHEVGDNYLDSYLKDGKNG
jgi:predicted transcriptional regulator